MDFIQVLQTYWLQISAVSAGIAGFIAGLVRLYKSAKPIVLQIYQFIQEHLDLPQKIDAIYKEIRPNGGGSMKDAVGKLQQSVAKIEKRQIAEYMNSAFPCLETDDKGDITWVNRSYLRMLNTTFEEVQGKGWKNFVHPKDRERIFKEWQEAVDDKREYRTTFSFISQNGGEIPVHGSALPIGKEGYICFLTKGDKHLDSIL